MAKHQREDSNRRSRDGGEGKPYLGEKGESVFIRTSGKGDFKIVNLISRATFALVDSSFSTEQEARLFAEKRKLRIADYNENACSAPSNKAHSSVDFRSQI